MYLVKSLCLEAPLERSSNPVDYIEKYPERTKRLLGISYQEWQELTAVVIAYEQQQQEKLESVRFGLMRSSGGRKAQGKRI